MTSDKKSPGERSRFICEALLMLEAISPGEAGKIWTWLNDQNDSIPNIQELTKEGAFSKYRIILGRLLENEGLTVQHILKES